MKRGFAKIEFFTNLDYFKKAFKKGFVVSKILYEKAKKEKKIQMSYTQFNKYFKEFLIKQKNLKSETNTHANNFSNPIKLEINAASKKVFDPKFKKNIAAEDLL